MAEFQNIKYHDDILFLFRAALEKDEHEYVKKWAIDWKYQTKRQKRRVQYASDVNQDFHEYFGPQDLLKWFLWMCDQEKPDYLGSELTSQLIHRSLEFDKTLEGLSGFDWSVYHSFIGMNNAQDYIFANLYPHPVDVKSPVVLDFGAGYGRQANLWTQMNSGGVYIGMDGIPKSYCLQHYYYASTQRLKYEYVLNTELSPDFDQPGIYHLPTWRSDLIPSNSVDKILAVQVLPELSATLVKEMLKVFQRILKPAGVLYIRDSDDAWRPGHKLKMNTVLERNGFTLEYRAHVVDGTEISGIPRIWRKSNPGIRKPTHITLKQRAYELAVDFDAATGGRLKQILKTIFGASKQSQ